MNNKNKLFKNDKASWEINETFSFYLKIPLMYPYNSVLDGLSLHLVESQLTLLFGCRLQKLPLFIHSFIVCLQNGNKQNM